MLRSVQSSKVVALVDGPVQRCDSEERSFNGFSIVFIALFSFVIKVTSEGTFIRRYEGTRFVRPVAPEIFDWVAFERELKGNFASRGPSLRRGAHQKPQTRSRGSGGVRARVESEGTLRAPRARSALLPRNRARHAVRRRAVEWENSVLKVKIDQNGNLQITVILEFILQYGIRHSRYYTTSTSKI